jgi:hypothetical protein
MQKKKKGCISQFSVAIINTWANQLQREKDLFLITVLEVSMHYQLAPVVLGPVAVDNGESTRGSKIIHFMVARNQKRERKGGWGPSRVCPQWPGQLHLLKFPTFPNSSKLGTKSLTQGPLENIPDPNYSSRPQMVLRKDICFAFSKVGEARMLLFGFS